MTITKDAAAPQFRTACINKNDAFEKQQQTRVQLLRDGLTQQQQQKIRIQNIVMC